MKTNNNFTRHIFVTGTLIAGSLLASGAPSTLKAESLFSYNPVGTGSEMRSNLLNTSPNRVLDLACGNKSESKSEKSSAESKSKDAKCGEKKVESKSKDGKCGEGKCGESKADTKKAASKSKDGKCGEGKCGGSSKETTKSSNTKKEATPATKK